MKRRRLITSTFAVIGGALTGCLGNQGGGFTNTAEKTTVSDGGESTPTESNCPDNQGSEEQMTICETQFNVLNHSAEDESASVDFMDESLAVTGAIKGSNGCYTARLNDVRIADRQIVVSVESYEDADEDMDCTMAIIFIEYEVDVKITGDSPTTVSIEHNGEVVTTEQSA